ncbi:hypothetical protein JCM8547_000567 [Rhodosporidiobolus lusitaniae]
MADPFAASPTASRARSPPLQTVYPSTSSTSAAGPSSSSSPALAHPRPSISGPSSRPPAFTASTAASSSSLTAAVDDRSPPLTPTPTPSSSFGQNTNTSISAARMRAISPPTPAPSPQPHSRTQLSTVGTSRLASTTTSPFFDPALLPPVSPSTGSSTAPSESSLVERLRAQVNALSPLARQALMAHLIHDSTAADLSSLLPLIKPRLKRDFLKTLPLELAFHVLSFMDDARTLARASAVSRFWRALLEDEATWKRMCWRSGFVPPVSALTTAAAHSPEPEDDHLFSPPSPSSPSSPSPTTPFSATSHHSHTSSSTSTTGERLRTLEFLPRPSLEDDQLYTPAGRERRGTLDRNALSEFAARAELFDLPVAARAGGGGAGTSGMGLGLGQDAMQQQVVANAAAAELAVPRGAGQPSGLAARRGRGGVQPLTVPQAQQQAGSSMSGGAALDVSDLRSSLTSVTSGSAAAALSALPPHDYQHPHHHHQQQQPHQLVSPPMFAIPNALPPLLAHATPVSGSQQHSSPSSHFPHPSTSSASSSSHIPSFPPPPLPSHSRPPQPQPFSYKRHFKTAYLTQDAWLHGPGRLLSTQMSADDGVVTSLGFDDEWIVVGMATSKVHVFEAELGTYVRTLEGHELGVWCLTLVSKGGGPRGGVAGEAAGWEGDGGVKGKGRATFERPEASPMGTTFSQPGLSFSSSSTLNVPGLTGTGGTNFFRDGATTPLAASFHSSPSSPSHGRPSGSNPSSSSSSSAPLDSRHPRRRRSFPSSSSTSPPPSSSRPSSFYPSSSSASQQQGEEGGGLGIGAGGPTGDAAQQAGVCGTARGWGQEGAVVVSGGCDRDVRVWDVETGECLHTLRGHTSTVRCMRILDGRPIAVSGSRDKTVRVWDIERGECLHVLNGHQLSVRCLEVSGNKVVSGSYDATCRLWNVDTGECLHVFRGHIHQIYAVAFDGVRVVTGSLDSTVRIWSAETGEFLALLQGHTSLVGQLQLDPSSNVLVTGGSDGRVLVFDLDSFQPKHVLQAHANSVTCLQSDSKWIVSASNDGHIKLWDFQTGQYIRDLAEPSDAVWRVTVRNDKVVTLCRKQDRTLMSVSTFRPSEEELEGRAGGK